MGEEVSFLTAREVATLLRRPLSTVYKLTQNKLLPAFKVGKRWRYRKESIDIRIKELECTNNPRKELSES